MKILFLHGWQSTPGGVKPTYLTDHGHTVVNPALPDDDFAAAVRIAQAEFDRHQPDVLVGSSRGGAVAMNIESGETPLVLLCPAWRTWGTANTVKPNTVILHSRADEVVPFADTEELVRNSDLSSESLIEVGTEHRLADEESLTMMLGMVLGHDLNVKKNAGDDLPHEAGFPRRFGIGTLLIVTTVFGVLFAGLQALGCPPIVFFLALLFFTAVGLGQALLFGGKHPRRASVIVGAVFYPSIIILFILYMRLAGDLTAVRGNGSEFFLFFVLGSIYGAIAGYVAGVLVASGFLLMDKARCWRTMPKARHHDEDSIA